MQWWRYFSTDREIINEINKDSTCDATLFQNFKQVLHHTPYYIAYYIALFVDVTKKLPEILKLTVLSNVDLGEGVQTQSNIACQQLNLNNINIKISQSNIW